jgi:signal transduction histidine kinase
MAGMPSCMPILPSPHSLPSRPRPFHNCRSGETLLTLITDILDFSRIEANRMSLHNATFRLDTVIEGVAEPLRPGVAACS